jgi:hypothetical protein
VTISGFGTLLPKFRDACMRRNPQTGEPIHVAPRWAVAFRPGTRLKTAMVRDHLPGTSRPNQDRGQTEPRPIAQQET